MEEQEVCSSTASRAGVEREEIVGSMLIEQQIEDLNFLTSVFASYNLLRFLS